MLISFCSKEMASQSMVYSYKHGFSGFAAMLTKSQAQKVAGICANKNYIVPFFFFFNSMQLIMYLCQQAIHCILSKESLIAEFHIIFQNCPLLFESYQIAFLGYKPQGVGISQVSLHILLLMLSTIAAWVMELSQGSLIQVHSLSCSSLFLLMHKMNSEEVI